MAFKVGDAVRLKSGGAQMTVSKLFKSPEGREMVQCTWFDKKPREHRAAFVRDSWKSRKRQRCALGKRSAPEALQSLNSPWDWCRPRPSDDGPCFNGTPVMPVSLMELFLYQ